MTAARRPGASGHRRPALGLLVLGAAVVLGVVLLPSATRPPLAVASSSPPPTTTTTTAPAAPTTTTTTVPPGTVHVLVANGTTVPHGAGSVTSYLSSKGFGTLPAVDATDTHLSSSTVYVVNNADPVEGQEVASVLGLPAADVVTSGTPPVASVAGATVVVVLGPQLANRYAGTSTSSTTG